MPTKNVNRDDCQRVANPSAAMVNEFHNGHGIPEPSRYRAQLIFAELAHILVALPSSFPECPF